MANRRTGRDRGESGRPGSLTWREDQSILDRIQEGAKLRSRGLNSAEIAKQLGCGVPTVYQDRDRLLELRKEQAIAAVDEHIENLRQQQREVIAALEETDTRSINVGQLRSLRRQIEMDIAKLDGSLIERKEVKGEITNLLELINAVAQSDD